VDVLKISLVAVVACLNVGCQLTYYAHTAYHQTKLIADRQPVEWVLKRSPLTDEQRRKLLLVGQVRAFAKNQLGLKVNANYTTYVDLGRPYVSYIVQAAKFDALEAYLWRFPVVGRLPYKGYFVRELADQEAARFDRAKYDVHVRGVSAYSTLGWLQDSILSSMLEYDDWELVELILHETIHINLFIKSHADFNERLATFMGHEGMKRFYLHTEGPTSAQLARARDDAFDQALFSQFFSKAFDELKSWYEARAGTLTNEAKSQELARLQEDFRTRVLPRMKTKRYARFADRPLNNAILMAYRTYEYDLKDFEAALRRNGDDFGATMKFLKTLESAKDPEEALRAYAQK
jgi:predicted aminopeptidase